MQWARQWAANEFGKADLGDARRNARLIAVAAEACERPSGKVASVFQTDRELQATYDFLENDLVPAEEVTASLVSATVERCEGLPFVYVPVDGTSNSVGDHTKTRDFGHVGSTAQQGRGLKVVDALAVDPRGTVVGWLALTYWARQPTAKNAARDTH